MSGNMQWQPIETAPKEDDAEYLVWWGQADVVIWSAQYGQWEDRRGMCVSPDDEDAPTHWMPLPAPPEADA